jgi:flagellar basal-body rod protein FlgB
MFQKRDGTDVDLFDTSMIGLERGMAGANLREQVLSNNLANANTPGFKRSDVDFHDVLAQAFSAGDNVSELSNMTFSIQNSGGTTMTADGNNVDVDTEMSDLAQNSLDYQGMTSVLASRVGILKTAIGSVS